MNEMPEFTTDRKRQMLPQEIADVFSKFGLEKEEDREKLRSLAEAKSPEPDKVRIFLAGTTSGLLESQGGRYA